MCSTDVHAVESCRAPTDGRTGKDETQFYGICLASYKQFASDFPAMYRTKKGRTQSVRE